MFSTGRMGKILSTSINSVTLMWMSHNETLNLNILVCKIENYEKQMCRLVIYLYKEPFLLLEALPVQPGIF